jgi:hypothetical protein
MRPELAYALDVAASPVAVAMILLSPSQSALTQARAWITRHERPVQMPLSLAIGTTFIVDALP